jgi:hypothetical protein
MIIISLKVWTSGYECFVVVSYKKELMVIFAMNAVKMRKDITLVCALPRAVTKKSIFHTQLVTRFAVTVDAKPKELMALMSKNI